MQNLFLAALERLGTQREPAPFPGWIGAIARRRAADVFRAGPADSMTSELQDLIQCA